MTENDKALRYIGLLNQARLNGRWGEIQELARKVDKHAPHRKCRLPTSPSPPNAYYYDDLYTDGLVLVSLTDR